MKMILSFITAIIFASVIFAQAPQKMSYQAVIRNATGGLVANGTAGIRISIIQNSPTGTVVYEETHTVGTNNNGLVSLEIGGGTAVSGIFANINWVNGPYFLKTETDPTGGTNYSIAGINQLLSVPYALYSENSWSLRGNKGTNMSNFIGTTDNQPLRFRVNNQEAGYIDQSNQNNIAFGKNALENNFSGFNNAVYGARALYHNYSGGNNIAIGCEALHNNTEAGNNIAIGSYTLHSQTVNGKYNVAIGDSAMYHGGGYYNVAVGSKALFSYGNFPYNTALGYQSLYSNVDGYYNTGLGANTDVSANDLILSTAVGYNAVVNASYRVLIGGSNITTIGGYAPWSNFSDGRFKENVQENVPGLDFITRLRPLTYTLNTKKIDEHVTQMMPDSVRAQHIQSEAEYTRAQTIIHTGFIAQDVERTAREIGYRFDGVNAPTNSTDNYSIAYSQFVPALVKAVQELAEENKKLKAKVAEINALKSDLQLMKEKMGLK